MIRPLSPGERALAENVFGPALDPAPVRLARMFGTFSRAFVPGRVLGRDWIIWPARHWREDLSQGDLHDRATLVHELVHVWQAQQGVFLPWAKLKAGDGPTAYAYDCDDHIQWDALNIEQQARVVEHRYRLSQGAAAPGDTAFYQRVCPF